MILTLRCRVFYVACAVCLLVGNALAQDKNSVMLMSNPGAERTVTGAPYSAEGTTTVKMRMYDGTRIERNITAKFYRDSVGRIRREQTVVGLEVLDPSNDFRAVVTIFDPVAGEIITLNPGSRTAHRLSLKELGSASPSSTPSPAREPLGSKDIDGLTVTGVRSVTTIPAGQVGNDRPIQIIDEEWESPELHVVLYSLHSDPRTGDIEFRLSKISRSEPAKELFQVPAGYKIMAPDGSR